MPDSYTNLLYHIVFSTKDRRPLITPEYEIRLYDYLGGTIRKLGGICWPNFVPIVPSRTFCGS
jgi:putative transposase